MWKRYAVGIAVYAVFFAAIILSTTDSITKAVDLVVISAAALFWLGFSVYRVILWIRASDSQAKRERQIATYPHWFYRFAMDEPNDCKEHTASIGQIDTI